MYAELKSLANVAASQRHFQIECVCYVAGFTTSVSSKEGGSQHIVGCYSRLRDFVAESSLRGRCRSYVVSGP